MPKSRHEQFAHRVFLGAGFYGFIVLLPQYSLELLDVTMHLVPLAHPEHFYGFLGVALAWQLAFVAIAAEPARLRPLIPAAIAEKFVFGVSSFALILANRAPVMLVPFASVDIGLGMLFLWCYKRLR